MDIPTEYFPRNEPNMSISPVCAKEAERKRLEADAAAFLRKGGKIRQCSGNESGIQDYAKFATNAVLTVGKGNRRARAAP